MNRPVSRLATLLFASGTCALVYQVAWFRELRIVFGASTAATASVLALFSLGLCAGGLVLGRRADRHPSPVGLYAALEVGIAASAALSPILVAIVRRAYVAVGGTIAPGVAGGTIVRLVASALVLAVPTFLMGGTLPAAARGAETDDDAGRRRVGFLYGANTIGAVTGCLVANFWLLETLGTTATLYAASAANLVVGLLAWRLARGDARAPESDAKESPPAASRYFVLAAAAVVGFAFFVMEIVWYRMLGPILGGTVFTFGLILAVALLGIGIGGACFSIVERRRDATLRSFALTALLEAVCLAVPYALGDRVATLALLLRPLMLFGFAGLVMGWTLVALVVVLPAACVAGFQFPMLIGILGRGRSGVGRQTGQAYAWNTAGAVAGALGGGFLLLPAMGAPGCWRAVAYLLAALGLAAAFVSPPVQGRHRFVAPVVLAAIVTLLLRANGPTALWRHSPIGVGRVPPEATSTSNSWHAWQSAERRGILWETDGVESAVAVSRRAGLAFVINGKVDGHIRADAPTQVMSGMVGALLHPNPENALVIGLGTGSSAGWLGAIPEIRRVDVVELEPAIVRVARDCAAVNHDVMTNPKVNIMIGDAREVLMVTRQSYDLVVSEPSNPYRAGIASLFTREYYQAAIDRLKPGGMFLQWVQAYDVDSRTVRRIYATLGSVFQSVQTWELGENDLLLVASREPAALDAARLRERIRTEPFKTALAVAWRAIDLEGFFAHFVAGPTLARAIADERPLLNTDDRTLIEFAFARSAANKSGFDGAEVLATARARREDRPAIAGELDWDRVEDARISFRTSEGDKPDPAPRWNLAQRARAASQAHYLAGQWQAVLGSWQSQAREPSDPTEIAMIAETMAERGDPAAIGYADRLRELQPAEADAVIARLLARQDRVDDAMDLLEKALGAYRTDPWPWPAIMRHAVELTADLATHDQKLAARAYRALRDPFAGYMIDEMRTDAMLVAAGQLALETACVEALAPLEPHVPWRLSVLSWRKRCYAATKHPMARRAAEDVDKYLAREAVPFGLGLADVELQ